MPLLKTHILPDFPALPAARVPLAKQGFLGSSGGFFSLTQIFFRYPLVDKK
jgi:hypothetical protein